MAKEKTFIKITNKDIYDEIQDIKKTISDFTKTNDEAHEIICAKQDKTNGSVKLSKWMATTAVTIALLVLGFLFQHMAAVP